MAIDAASRKVVMPGDVLGMEEEYLAERNAYSENGNVYAAVFGEAEFESGKAKVKSFGREIKKIERGMPVLGVVVSDIGRVLFVKIDEMQMDKTLYVPSNDGKIVKEEGRQRHGFGGRGRMHARHDEALCKEGDVILARVARMENDMYELDMREPETGIIYARCTNCGADLKYKEDMRALFCDTCKRAEHGKISTLYGKPDMIKSFLEKQLLGREQKIEER
ncbi:MAG: exosome complex RNA-binding protein Csl4 [Candidatus Micrarchaeia archaeon]